MSWAKGQYNFGGDRDHDIIYVYDADDTTPGANINDFNNIKLNYELDVIVGSYLVIP